MTIANRLEEVRTAKQNIKQAIQDELGEDLSEVAFVDYYKHIKSSGGGGTSLCTPTLEIIYPIQDEYLVGESITFTGIVKTPETNIPISNAPITYNNTVIATSDEDGAWSYTTTWVNGGCEFSIIDSTYGLLCKELINPINLYDDFIVLEARINELGTGETLLLDCNYKYTGTSENGAGVNIPVEGVTIDGQGKYCLDGNLLSRCVNINAPSVTLKGLTFKNGKLTSGDGAGVNNYNSSTGLSIVSCVFTDCTAQDRGGAIYNWGGEGFTVTDSTFTDCTAQDRGGAIYNEGGEGFTVTDSTFTDCSSAQDRGGAIYNWSGEGFTVTDSTFTDCTAQYRGGAIYNGSGEGFTVTDSTFTGNTPDNISGSCEYAQDCYWGTNTPNESITLKDYAQISIDTGATQAQNTPCVYIKALQYDTTTSTLTSYKVPLRAKVTTTIGETVYTGVMYGGYLIQRYTLPESSSYTVSVQVENGKILTKTVEA